MNTKTKDMVMTALMAAVICVLGPLSIPIGPVPISLVNFAIYITMYILGTKRGSAAVCLYVLIGLVGIPVFSGFTGGAGKLLGPTGGYIIGYIPMAIVLGLLLENHWKHKIECVIFMELVTWIPYLLGTAWLAFQAGMTFPAAFAVGVLPFIAEDLVKMIIAAILGPVLKTRLSRYTMATAQ